MRSDRSGEGQERGAGEPMRRLHPMTLVQRLLVSLPAVLVVVLPLRNPDANAWIYLGFLLLYGLFVIPVMIVQFVRFRYQVTPKEIIIHRGVFTYRHRNIPIERIQNIEIEQSLLPRLLGTAKVKIETAGSADTEGVIEYVSLEEARRIRSTVQAYQRASIEEAYRAGPEAATASGREEVASTDEGVEWTGPGLRQHEGVGRASLPLDPERRTARTSSGGLLFRMDIPRVLLSGVFRFSLLYIVLIFSATEYLGITPEEIASWIAGERLDAFARALEDSPFLVIAATTTMVLLLAWLTGIATNFNKFYGFRLARDGDKLQIRHGLLTVSEGTIPLKKIQSFVFRSNPLMAAFGWCRLELQTVGFDPNERGNQVAAPFAKYEEALDLARAIRPLEDPGEFLSVSKLMIRRTFVRYVVAFAVATGVAAFFWTQALWALAALPGLFVIAVFQYRRHGFRIGDEFLYVRRGVFRRQLWIVPFERFQVFYQTQSLFQRRLGLQSVFVDTAGSGIAGHPEVIDLPADQADHLIAELYRRFQEQLSHRRPAPRPAAEITR